MSSLPSRETFINPESKILHTKIAFERNAAFVEEQTGLEIAGHLARLSNNIKSDPLLIQKMNTYQIFPPEKPAKTISDRFFLAAKTLALKHDPDHPISFGEFQQHYQDYDLKPEDVLALREHMYMYREAVRSKERTLEAVEVQEELAHDATGLLTRSGLIQEISRIRQIIRTKQNKGLTHRKIDSGNPLPIYTKMDGRVLILDIDHLKKINDVLGHAAGDKAIQEVADAIQNTIRDSDLACRCGGDEFFVLLPGENEESATLVYERIKKSLPKIGLSAGIGRYAKEDLLKLTRDPSTFETLLKHADDALYHSKNHGRNQLTINQEPWPPAPKLPPPHHPESHDDLQDILQTQPLTSISPH